MIGGKKDCEAPTGGRASGEGARVGNNNDNVNNEVILL